MTSADSPPDDRSHGPSRPVAEAIGRTRAEPLRRDGDVHLPAGPKARRTREKLLATAAALFEEHGYQCTSVAAIVEKAGVSFGTFYQYFADRSAVIAALLNDYVADYVERSSTWSELPAPEGFPVMIRDFVRGYQAQARFSGVWEEASMVDPASADLRRDLARIVVEGVERQLLLGGASGSVPAMTPDEARLTAVALSGMVDRFCYITYVFDPPASPPDPDEAAQLLTGLWLKALGLDAGAARPVGTGTDSASG